MDSMGVQAFSEMKKTTKTEADPRINNYVKCVAQPITEAAKGREHAADQWEVVVFKDDSANAFALPGGKIGVHTGLLKVAKTDSQLAAVLGHEVGHVLARHGNERVSEAFAAQGGLAAASVALGGGEGSSKKNLLMAALGLGTQFGVLLPHSRGQESEADIVGLDLMSQAGFDPRESVELWKNMMANSQGAPPEFMSTHPAGETRISHLESNMKDAMVQYEKAQAEGRRPKCQM